MSEHGQICNRELAKWVKSVLLKRNITVDLIKSQLKI